MENGPLSGIARLLAPLGEIAGGTTTWIVLPPTGALPRIWKVMVASTPPVTLVMSAPRLGLVRLISTSPARAVLAAATHVPLAGGLVISVPRAMSVLPTVKTVGS